MKTIALLSLLFTLLSLSACGKKAASNLDSSADEVAQQIGDVMASVDESGGSSATLGYQPASQPESILRQTQPLFARHGAELPFHESNALQFLLPEAHATTCQSVSNYGFSSCSSNSVTRTFGGCTIGQASLNGTVTLTWGGSSASCAMTSAGGYVDRVPNYTVTGLRGAALTVAKSGTIGQRIAWTSGSGSSKVFAFSNDGIRRVFSVNGNAILDFTTTTTSNITITGTARVGRVITGGALQVTNNVSGRTCSYVPTNITWTSSSCNCPTSGSWAGSCSDGSSSSLTITGCGTADFSIGSDSSGQISFDRCN